ncbi:hypothetical protein HHK36_019121 [Tetracentron sinense]|uniref:Uncharacterized protein n=1 Tax=Tetracentron sinense TaxID=13715 RepID=A0A835DCH0_TETSI|nr:hypothetical protein HHK36_019121 [Tetracentron sinense]
MSRTAEKASWNSVVIFKLSNISGKRHELLPTQFVDNDSDMDSDSCDSDEDNDEEGYGGSGPLLRKVAHDGCVNHIRGMQQKPHICPSWGETGHVQVWDFNSHLNALAESETENCIHLWEPTSGGAWNVNTNPFVGHAASVEDLQVHIELEIQ